MAEHQELIIYEDKKFSSVQRINLEEYISKDHKILYLDVSKDQQKIGICLGVLVIKEDYKITDIMIFKRDQSKNGSGKFIVEKQKQVDLTGICPEFKFNDKNTKELFFFSANELMKMNYSVEDTDMETVYKFDNPLGDIPNFGSFNDNQTKFIITSSQDVLYVDTKQSDPSKREIDFDDKEEIGEIKNICATKDRFYVLANKKESKLGFYLFSIELNDPENQSEYFIRWNNKLDIGDADMYYMTEKNEEGIMSEYMVVSYKCIGINTFNVFVFDLHDKLIKFWFEGYQLWESPLKGFLLHSNDFLVLSKEGISLLALGTKESKEIIDNKG
jgi:hypothetical protein